MQVRVVRVEAAGRDAPRLAHQLRRRRRLVDVVLQALLGGGTAGGRVHGLGDDGAHAHDRRGDGDEPEPAAVRARDHLDVARAASLAPGHALELGVHGHVAQHGIDHALAEALGQEPGAAGGIHDGAHAHGVREALGIDVVDGRALGVEDRVQRARPLQDLRPAALRVPEQDVVEALTRDLVGLRRRCLHRTREIGVLGGAAVVRREARAPLVRRIPLPGPGPRTPRVRKTSLLQGSWLSPMWKRGNVSRSRSRTRWPLRASCAAAEEPPGPPPITATS